MGWTVQAKVMKIQGEQRAEFIALGNPNQGRICEIHGKIAVLFHQLLNSRDIHAGQLRDVQGATCEPFPQGILGWT